jgi:hypothetical protein
MKIRQLLAGLTAAGLGAVASLTVATPSQAASTCTVSYTIQDFTTPVGPKADVFGKITNTGTTTSANWFVIFGWPSGVTTTYWNLTRSTFSGNVYYASSWNKQIQPGDTLDYGFEITKPSTEVSSTPTIATCGIVY